MNAHKAHYMKKIAVGLLALTAGSVFADSPQLVNSVTPGTISYQGRLETSDGTNYPNGVYDIEFRVYDEASGGTALWGATYKPYVSKGYFSVLLGQTGVGETALTTNQVQNLWTAVWIDPSSPSKNRFLGITATKKDGVALSDPQESFPRYEMLASPYAIQAQFAQQAEESSDDFLVRGSLTVSQNFSSAGTVYAPSLVITSSIVVGGGISVTQAMSSAGTLAANNLNVSNAVGVGGAIHANTLNVTNAIGAGGGIAGRSVVASNYFRTGNIEFTSTNSITVPDNALFTIGTSRPFELQSYSVAMTGDVATTYGTPYGTNFWIGSIVGVDFGFYDVYEQQGTRQQEALMYKNGNTWAIRIQAPYVSGNSPTVVVHTLFIRKELANDMRSDWGTNN